MRSTIAQDNNIVILRVGWPAYETLLDESRDVAGHRFAYDAETLEILSSFADPERYNRLLERLLGFLANESRINVESFRSTTLKLKPRGAEPDFAFYVQNASKVIGKSRIDLKNDPPPDLAVEIDISRERIDKKAIYASLRSPEYWR